MFRVQGPGHWLGDVHDQDAVDVSPNMAEFVQESESTANFPTKISSFLVTDATD